MKKHEILSPQFRAALFDPPTEPAAIVRHYTLSPEDLALIRQRRRNANRLGFAVHLAYLRFPGRVLGAVEIPPPDILAFIAGQLGIAPEIYTEYARREETRWEHLGELQAYLKVRPFQREDYRAVAQVAVEEAAGTDRGEAIVTSMIGHLRKHAILLPASATLEKIGLAARAHARKRAYRNLAEGLPGEAMAQLDALIVIDSDKDRTPLTWLREWSEAPTQKNLAGIVERLQSVRALNIGADREQRIHRARYAAIARETAILSAQHLSRFDTERRLATLVVFAREMEAILTDAGIAMFDKMLGSVFRRADHEHRDRMINRAKVLDASSRALLGMAKAMLAAKAAGTDPLAAVDSVWPCPLYVMVLAGIFVRWRVRRRRRRRRRQSSEGIPKTRPDRGSACLDLRTLARSKEFRLRYARPATPCYRHKRRGRGEGPAGDGTGQGRAPG